ncbi:MAG: glycoside hydrolase family 9 protein [Oscillospiraceae bacterium]|nr:glycoside hydrolase family 9 protein [Oscillospiraceae bacterium]
MKHTKKLLAAAAALLLCTQGLHVRAGELLGQSDFEEGVGLPWHICESATGRMDFTIDDGTYNITVIDPGGVSNGGEDRWDCQFRHRNLTLVQGHTYRLTYSVWASNSGWLYSKIGNMTVDDAELWHSNGNQLNMSYDGNATQSEVEAALRSAQPNGQWGDYNQWQGVNISGNQWNTFAYEFTLGSNGENASSVDGVGEWTFHFGGDGQYTPSVCFPAGTELRFDNLCLLDMNDDTNDYPEPEVWQRADILTNQVGYFPNAAKRATLLETGDKALEYWLIDESGSTVYTGESRPMGFDKDSGDTVHVLDFSDFNGSGTFHLEADNGAVSREFSIGITDTYSSLLYDALNYYYQNRSGIPIEAQYITSGDAQSLARAAGHPSDNAVIQQSWDSFQESGQTQDVTGGWYDAGDHGKYVVNGGISLWMLQNAYERALSTGAQDAFADGSMSLPEASNGYPDLLDEARYEMEWMLRMTVQDGEYKGMAYHKVHDIKWTALAVAPADDPEVRILKPPTTAATLNLAACAAQSYRLWKDLDKSFADTCLETAKAAYEAAKAHPDMYAPLDQSVGGGAYGDDKVSDEFYWAACELWAATGDDTYYQDLSDAQEAFSVPDTMDGGEAVGIPGSFDWGHTAALGSLTLVLHRDLLTDKAAARLEENLTAAADYFLSLEESQGYGIPYAQSTISYADSDKGYVWGSNSVAADNAVILAYAYDLNGNSDYLNGTVSAMDYLLGRNPMDVSYVTGYGTHSVQYPHHRWWSNLISKDFPKAPCGVLVGGPNSGMEDPWVRGSGWKKGEIAPEKCYMDHIEAWSVNECTINWNAPLAWLTAYLCEQNGGVVTGSHTGAVNDGGSGVSNDKQTYDSEAAAQIAEAHTEEDNSTSVSKADSAGKEDPDSGQSHASDDQPDKAAASSNIPWIVGGVLAGLISIEVFLYLLVRMLRKNKS